MKRTDLKRFYLLVDGYIIGFEYYSKERKEIEYRNLKNMLWADDFIQKYINVAETIGTELKLVYEKDYVFKNNRDKISKMFVLKRLA